MQAIKYTILVFLFFGHSAQMIAQNISAVAQGIVESTEEERITAIAVSENNQLLLSGDEDGNISVIDLNRKTINATYYVGREILFVEFIDERTFVVADNRGNIKVYDLGSNRVTAEFEAKRRPEQFAMDRSKRYLAILNSRKRIELFDVIGQMPVGLIDAREEIDDLIYFDFDRLGQQIIAINELAEVYSWNPSTLSLIRNIELKGNELHGSRNVVKSASSNMQSNIFAVGLQEVAIPRGGIGASRDLTRQNYIIGYDWNSGIEIKRVNINWEVEDILMGPGGDHVSVTNSENQQLSIVDLQKGEIAYRMNIPENTTTISISEDGNYLTAGRSDGKINVWQLEYQETRQIGNTRLPSISGRVRALSTSEPLLSNITGNETSLAILEVESRGIDQEVADIALFSMSNSLSNISYLEVVERSQIEQVISEQEFQLGDLTEDQGVRVGKLLNVEYVLLSSIGKLGNNIILNGRIVSVETGEVIGGRQVICETCQDQDILEAVSALSDLIAQ